MNDKQLVIISNTIWFGFWFILVFFKGLSPWWFMFPACFHWTISDYNPKKDKII
jgi:hypothetical protein